MVNDYAVEKLATVEETVEGAPIFDESGVEIGREEPTVISYTPKPTGTYIKSKSGLSGYNKMVLSYYSSVKSTPD